MPRVTGLGHVGIFVRDPALMVEFYGGFLGLTVTDRGANDGIVFLSARPGVEHHELALVRDEHRTSDPQQLSFTVGSLAELRAFYAEILERGDRVDHVVNHGNAFGCYFRDPEGNQVEVYWPTGRDWPQPYADPIDLTMSEAALLRVLEEMPAAPA